jgi:parallel beta helix pectate lyase-like protein
MGVKKFRMTKVGQIISLFVMSIIVTAGFMPSDTFATSRVVNVSNASGLTTALGQAAPGDRIQLANGVYKGNFVAKRSGTSAAHIVLIGTRNAILDGNSISAGYVLHLKDAHFWEVRGMKIQSGQKGIVADRSNNAVLDNVEVYNIGQEAVHFRSCSSSNIINNNYIHSTGVNGVNNKKDYGYGEGIYIGNASSNWKQYSECKGEGVKNGKNEPDTSNYNQITNNTISATTAESIDIKEGTTGGTIRGNRFDGASTRGANSADSWVDVKGNNYLIAGNTGFNTYVDGFQTHVEEKGWGRYNTFDGNNIHMNTSSGYGVKITVTKKEGLGNIVKCNNVIVGKAKALTNLSQGCIR